MKNKVVSTKHWLNPSVRTFVLFALCCFVLTSAGRIFNGFEDEDEALIGRSTSNYIFQTDEEMLVSADEMDSISDRKLSLSTFAVTPSRSPTIPPTFAPSLPSGIPSFSLGGAYFNGSNSIMIGTLPNVAATFNYMTLSLWVNTTTKNAYIVSLSRTTSTYNGELIIQTDGNGKCNIWEYYGGYGLSFTAPTIITTGYLMHIAFVKSYDTGYLYINGKLDTTSTTTTPVNNRNNGFNLGNDARSKSKYLKGWIKNLEFYNYAMGPNDVINLFTKNYKAPTAVPTAIPTLIPTAVPTTAAPSALPTLIPTVPTNPTYEPSAKPTFGPSIMPPTVPVIYAGNNIAPTIGFKIVNALSSGDASLVTGDELRTCYMELHNLQSNVRDKIIADIFTNASNGNKYTSISWNPTRNSVYFTIADIANTYPLMISNYDYGSSTYTTKPVPVAIAGYYKDFGSKYVAFANNPFAVPLDTDSASILKNTITWLNKGIDPSTLSNSFKVTIAHLPGKSSTYFSHDIPTHAWFADNYPQAQVNAINACDNDALDNCLIGSKLLVIGIQIDRINDKAVTALTTNVPQVSNAVRRFMEQGGSVFYVHYYRVGNPLSDALLPLMGLQQLSYTAIINYFRSTGLLNANPFIYEQTGTTMYKMIKTLHGITPLAPEDICTNVDEWITCKTNIGLNEKIKDGVDDLRSILGDYDNNAIDLFYDTEIQYELQIKLLVLLGDKYRTNKGDHSDSTTNVIKYPLALTNLVGMAQFMFADSSIAYTRKSAPAQDDLYSVYCSTKNTILGPNGCSDYQSFSDVTKVKRYDNVLIQDDGVYNTNVWTSTGVFAVPGQPFTVTRKDNDSDIFLYVALWYQRPWTTKSISIDTRKPGYYRYDRPQYLRSPYITLTKGQTITITSPTGGPIYFGIYNVVAADRNTSSPPIEAIFNNVARHPSIIDIGNDDQIKNLVNEIATNPIPIVDIKAPGMELHFRSDYLLRSLQSLTLLIDYSGVNGTGMMTLLNDLRYNFLEPQMTLAGFKAPGKQLSESLPTTILSACNLLQWNCTNSKIHQYNGIQHANYDEHATCGDGCSGNPFDMNWNVAPLGWGESHELGHNMQQSLLNIGWLPVGTSRDGWSNYQSRSGENSNNIFPYHNRWRYYRKVKGYNGLVSNNKGASDEGFMNLQSSYARIVTPVAGVDQQVIFDSTCTITNTFPVGTDVTRVALDTTYADNSYAADNNARMTFYLQLPLIMTGKTVVNNQITLTNGFEIFTLLYQGLRILKYIAKTDTTWKQYRHLIGFDLFPRTCASTDSCYRIYGTSSVTSMIGNDYILVMLTFLSGYDFRPYFDIRGLSYSTLAEQQVLAHIASGVANKGPISTDYYAINDYPPADLMNTTMIRKVPIDGISAWPFTGWTPAGCNKVVKGLSSDKADDTVIVDNKLWMGLIIAGSVLFVSIVIAIVFARLTVLRPQPEAKEVDNKTYTYCDINSSMCMKDTNNDDPTYDQHHEVELPRVVNHQDSHDTLDFDTCLDAMDELDEMERHHSMKQQLSNKREIEISL